MKNLLICLMILGSFSACKNKAVPTKIDDAGFEYFGAQITADNAMSYDDLLSSLASKDSLETKVIGKIKNVCQVKGCWMNIVSEDANAEEMFVKFKDYGFFMPLDSEGKTAIMRGKAFREVTSVDELRHYAEDEGKSPEEIAKITEPIEELKFMADGVIIKP